MNAKSIASDILLLLSAIRLMPHMLAMNMHPNKEAIRLDLERWQQVMRREKDNRTRFFIHLMTHYPEYRSLFYYRLKWLGKLLSPFCKPMPTLYIDTENVGSGLFIQHGFATIISAKRIGNNCWINQQVTIGYSNDTDCPTLGNNVVINSGAKVIGNVTIGDNAIVGANAVVVKNVPENCTVVGVPAYIVRKNGMKIREPL